MKVNQITAVYFSATGTTERLVTFVAGHISEKLGIPMKTYSFTLPEKRESRLEFCEGEIVIFGMPTYAGRVPNVLLPYLTEKVSGNGALAVPVVLFGNRNYDDSLIELRNILQENGFHTIAAGAFAGEHSFSYILGAGRPDSEDLKIAGRLADMVCERLEKMEKIPNAPVSVKGESPLRPYYTPRDRKKQPINILKVKPKVHLDECTNCKECAEVCPMGSIDREDITKYVGICIKCGACVKKCPTNARYYDDEGYLYHKTELEEEYARRAEAEIF